MKPENYDSMFVQEIFRSMDENVKDPKFLATFLQTMSDNLYRVVSRMQRAERALDKLGVKGAHRPITYRLIDEANLDAEILKEMAISLGKLL